MRGVPHSDETRRKPVRRPGYNFGQAKKAAFLASFRITGNITAACEDADIPRSLYYVWTEHDQGFALNVEQCKVEAADRLETVARSRAVDGVKKIRGVYHEGKIVGYQEETDFSDTLLIFLLKGLRPEKYRENISVTQTQVIKTIDNEAYEAV